MQESTEIVRRNQNVPMKIKNIARHRYMDRNQQRKTQMNLDLHYAECQSAGITLRDIKNLKSLTHCESEISCEIIGEISISLLLQMFGHIGFSMA